MAAVLSTTPDLNESTNLPPAPAGLVIPALRSLKITLPQTSTQRPATKVLGLSEGEAQKHRRWPTLNPSQTKHCRSSDFKPPPAPGQDFLSDKTKLALPTRLNRLLSSDRVVQRLGPMLQSRYGPSMDPLVRLTCKPTIYKSYVDG